MVKGLVVFVFLALTVSIFGGYNGSEHKANIKRNARHILLDLNRDGRTYESQPLIFPLYYQAILNHQLNSFDQNYFNGLNVSPYHHSYGYFYNKGMSRYII